MICIHAAVGCGVADLRFSEWVLLSLDGRGRLGWGEEGVLFVFVISVNENGPKIYNTRRECTFMLLLVIIITFLGKQGFLK